MSLNNAIHKSSSRNVPSLSLQDVNYFVKQFLNGKQGEVTKYFLFDASNNMLGFLSDYWKLKVDVAINENEKKTLHFFIKAISKTNTAKAAVVQEMNIFEKEVIFYTVIKEMIFLSDIKPWSPKIVTAIQDSNIDSAIILEDLNAIQYRSANKLLGFDIAHSLEALNTLARLHASCIIYEESRSKELKRSYSINEEFHMILNKGGYDRESNWFIQCINGTLEAVKSYSKYGKDNEKVQIIEKAWNDVWVSALELSEASSEHRNVICHRDLWNNNLMFHYSDKELNSNIVPDDCVLVDFQTARYQPPAGDIMQLLYCNLDRNIRESKMYEFLNYYYEQLKSILSTKALSIENILPKEKFLISAEEQRKWGLITAACLLPLIWIGDDLMTKLFTNTTQYEIIITKNRAPFILKMMSENLEYKNKILEIFEEIVERYCI